MAEKMIFITDSKDVFREERISYTFYSGFAVTQKQKSIASLHENIKKKYPESRILEVSRKSDNPAGIMLSAFNLRLYVESQSEEIPVENIFQSSKVFENGGPYRSLLKVKPIDAKRDERLKTSGALKCFCWDGSNWPLEPKSMFYDYIYISALRENPDVADMLDGFDIFTDIEFNEKKQINCQARACAIYMYLKKNSLLDKALNDRDFFKSLYGKQVVQLNNLLDLLGER